MVVKICSRLSGNTSTNKNNDDYCNDDEVIKWYEGYQKHKVQKAQIKKELMPIAWHQSRWWDCCVPQDEKKETEKLWG